MNAIELEAALSRLPRVTLQRARDVHELILVAAEATQDAQSRGDGYAVVEAGIALSFDIQAVISEETP